MPHLSLYVKEQTETLKRLKNECNYIKKQIEEKP